MNDPRPPTDDTTRERKRERFNTRDWDDDAPECQHDGATLEPLPTDPLLPEHVEPLECPDCGEVYHHDTDTGTVEVDG